MLDVLKKILFGVICILLLASVISGCNKRRENKELKSEIKKVKADLKISNKDKEESNKKLSKAKKKIKKLEQKLGKKTDDLIYMNIKFPSDGNFYKESNEGKIYYSDPTCTEKIDNPRFLSYKEDPETAENGLSINCLRLDSGLVCYTPRTETSLLITEEKWQEMKKEERKREKESAKGK